jgi:hypothetical protein
MGQLEGSGVHLVGLGGLVVWSRPDQTRPDPPDNIDVFCKGTHTIETNFATWWKVFLQWGDSGLVHAMPLQWPTLQVQAMKPW